MLTCKDGPIATTEGRQNILCVDGSEKKVIVSASLEAYQDHGLLKVIDVACVKYTAGDCIKDSDPVMVNVDTTDFEQPTLEQPT